MLMWQDYLVNYFSRTSIFGAEIKGAHSRTAQLPSFLNCLYPLSSSKTSNITSTLPPLQNCHPPSLAPSTPIQHGRPTR